MADNNAIAELNQIAAVTALSALEAAIKGLEAQLPSESRKGPYAAYFTNQDVERKTALQGLQRLKAELHLRAFQAYQETKYIVR